MQVKVLHKLDNRRNIKVMEVENLFIECKMSIKIEAMQIKSERI